MAVDVTHPSAECPGVYIDPGGLCACVPAVQVAGGHPPTGPKGYGTEGERVCPGLDPAGLQGAAPLGRGARQASCLG